MGGIVGIDVGGTFTDLFYSRDGTGVDAVLKVPSTPADPSTGLLDALAAARVVPADLDLILHGTTIATNAVIERKGARCALVTTQGFRDLLELGRRDRPSMYGMSGVQNPLIPRERRWEITERLDHTGGVVTPLDEAGMAELAQVILGQDVEAVVVSFLHAYANPAHEERARAILKAANPAWEVVTSSAVIREYYEFERTSTAAVQGYLQPLVSRYAANLLRRLETWGFSRQTLIMQSNGGVVPVTQLAERAASIVRSGPAAGVTAAAEIAAEAGFSHVITGDMGGTSFDVAVVIEGVPKLASTTNLEFRVPLRLPMIDVHTIGAGGGSIAWVDRSGILQVGPRSAGAVPGPVCYGRGGTEPTVTDANVVLARIKADDPIGLKDRSTLDLEGARTAVARLGEKLGLGLEATAEAILAVVNQTMAGRTRLLSVEQGYDPRDFAFVAFGGAGPLHGAAIIREVGIRTMLVPAHPGILCAFGCAMADLRSDLAQTIERVTDDLRPGEVSEILSAQAREGEAAMRQGEARIERVETSHGADMSYFGQIHTLRVPIERDWAPDRIVQAFGEVYAREYGNTLQNIPCVIVSLKTTVRGIRPKPSRAAAAPAGRSGPPEPGRRRVHFGEWIETPVYQRATLSPGFTATGPLIVEQPDTTTVIEPGMRARVDEAGNILVEMA